jgi:(2Fe-2S) ferredoxin
MPTYIDCHPLAAIPSAVQHQMHQEAMRGSVDQHGVQPLAHWVTDGVIYCVVQAPDAEAFCQHHAERGLPCDELHPIPGLHGSHPLSADETQLVRAVLTDLWPPIGCVAA